MNKYVYILYDATVSKIKKKSMQWFFWYNYYTGSLTKHGKWVFEWINFKLLIVSLKKQISAADIMEEFSELNTFMMVFSQGRLPKWQFPKWQLPKGYRLGSLRCHRLQWGPSAAARTDLPLQKLHIWEVAYLENTLGKLPLRKNPLRKYLTSLFD